MAPLIEFYCSFFFQVLTVIYELRFNQVSTDSMSPLNRPTVQYSSEFTAKLVGREGLHFLEHITKAFPLKGFSFLNLYKAVADLRGGARDTRPLPSGPKFLHFHAVFGKNWPNNRLVPPFRISAPSSGKSWIRHCKVIKC